MREKNCSSCKYQYHKADEMPCNMCFRSYIDKYEPLTNYDKIVNMDIREMAEFIVKTKLIFSEDIYNHIQEQIKDYVVKIDDKKIPKWKEKERKFYEKWLLQEVSNDE